MGDINLKNYVQKLIDLENEEERYKNIMTQLKKEKDTVSNTIMDFMERNKIENKDIIFGDSKIKYVQNKVQEGITKKLIQERLKLFLKNEQLALQATEFIYSDRNANIKKTLKIMSAENKKMKYNK